jgi:hypothetical protein
VPSTKVIVAARVVVLTFLDLGKLALLFCGLGNKIMTSKNSRVHKRLLDIIAYEHEYSRWFTHREKLSCETIIQELK